MGQRIEKLERLIKGKEIGKIKKREGSREMENRLKVERMLERKEKENKRRNIIIKGLGGERKRQERVVKEIMKVVEVKVEIKELRRMGEGSENGEEIVRIELGNKEQKWEAIERKKSLWGRKERIEENITWKKRKTRWKLREIVRVEEREGNRICVRQERIKIGKKWWRRWWKKMMER